MMNVDVNADVVTQDNEKSLEELTKEEFDEIKDNISIQSSYYFDNIGRVHIRQTGDYITGIIIDDNCEFHWECASMVTDLIIKVAIELLRYNKGQVINFDDIPLMIKESDEVIDFLNEITEIKYGSIKSMKSVKEFKDILDELEFDIIIPSHRIKNYKVPKNKRYYFDKLKKLES